MRRKKIRKLISAKKTILYDADRVMVKKVV